MQLGCGGEILLGHTGPLKMLAYATNAVVNHGVNKNTSRCGLQEKNHTDMEFFFAMARRMATPDEKREILRRFIKERGLKVAPWAKRAGVNANSLYNFLNGHSDGLDLRTYAKLAREADVPSWRLSGETPETASPTAVWVAGHVEAGNFRKAVEWDRSQWYSVDVPVPSRFRGRAKALEVRGPSMNRRYPPGAVVVWIETQDFREPRDGDGVIVYSYCNDDDIEATVKVLKVNNSGDMWLWPDSDDPEHQQPINPRLPPERVKLVEVKGIVIGSYRAEVY